MPLYFRPRSKRPLSRRTQFTLAFAALALALGVVAAWMAVAYYTEQSRDPDAQGNSSSAPPTVEYTDEDTGNLLMIFRDDAVEHFVLVQADPAAREMVTAPLAGNLTTDGETSLSATLAKSGPAKAAALVETALELPVSHYIQMTGNQVESFLNHLDSGVTLTLPQAIEFTDENGAKLQLKAGKHTLNATQAVSLLRYTGWKDKADGQRMAADLVCAVLDEYVYEGRYFSGDFASLSNLSQTDLRIGDFSTWRGTLEYLAASNDGALCSRVQLVGKTNDNGLFVPDNKKNRNNSPLY